MFLNESLNVYSSMEVLYWILRLFGYAPFRLQLVDTPGLAAITTWRTKAYSMSFGLAYTLAYTKFMSDLKHTGFSASIIEGKGERMYFTFNFFTTLYGVVNGYIVREKIEKMLYKLHIVDRKICRWKRNFNHRRLYQQIWTGVYLFAIVLLIYIYGTIITCQFHESSCKIQVLFLFIYLLFVISYALMMLQCTAFMEIIRNRYKLLNSCFRISLDSNVLKTGLRSLIVTRMHDIYFVLRYLTVIVVQVHVLNNGAEINRLLRTLNSISNAVVLLANRKEVCYVLVYVGTYTYAIYSFLFVANVADFHLSLIIGTLECINLCCQYLTMVFAIVFAWVVKGRVSSILYMLHDNDLQLSTFGPSIDHRKLHFKLSMLSVGIVASRLLSVLNVIILLLIGTLYINGPCRQIRRDMLRFQSSPLAVNSRIFTYLLGTLVYHLTMLINFLHRHRLRELFQVFVNIDRELQQVGVRINYRMHRFLITAGMVCFLSGIFVTSALVYAYKITVLNNQPNFDGRWYYNMFSFVYYNAAFPTITSYFTIVLWFLLVRFQRLAMAIRMYFPTSPSAVGNRSEFAICSEKEQINVLKQIKILHDKLNDVVELVNYCFSVQITFCVGLCFVIGVVCSFGLFRAFIYRNELFYMGVLNFIWYMYYLFFVLFFIAVGSKITREGKRIGILVHKAINCSSSSAVINELNLFSQQLLHRSPVITCGLFVYDWTLWYTVSPFLQMIGATATYLIILIQFDVSFPNLVNVNATAVYRSST
uniref:Gustatory receptor n=1 Tax=Anopheles epiroticus TaxID=199890 RepID=A0A182PR54_9DIPT